MFELRPLLEAEDRPEDDLEREPLEAGMKLERLIPRPRGQLTLGQLGHQPGQLLHPLPVEGRQHELTLLQVLMLVEQDHRVPTDYRLENPRALAGMKYLRWRGEHFLELVGVGQQDRRGLEGQLGRDPLAVTLPEPRKRGRRARP